MKHLRTFCLVGALIFVASAFAQTPAAKPPAPPATIASVADSEISIIERELVPAAEAMPEDKYNFAPTSGEFKGVRTFAQQVKHIANTNYILWSPVLGEKPAVDTANDNGPDSIKTKADIMKYLKDSFALGHRAAKSLTAENNLERVALGEGNNKSPRIFWVTYGVAHSFNHYGQIVEYLRMNGIVPPASRGSN
ncbi:MAG TPA: DinB family protein [Verrucomicrobiae bacterium]|nr:DinB family protein [Verrucomicrobiae bacterium]